MPETTGNDGASAMRRALKMIETLEAKVRSLEEARCEPIAIIGMACRLPGADSPEEFWRLLLDGRDALGAPPDDRPAGWGNHRGGFIRGATLFDAEFWGISTREATSMDPQQRLLLEVIHDALERAGQAAEMIRRSRTGIFLGISSSDYAFLASTLTDSDPFNFATGNGKSFTCGRVSYALELSGPSVAIDTACSSSLVAVDLACQSLRLRTSDMSIAAAVTLNLSPVVNETYTKAGVTSPECRCKTFDAAADGYARSEGCGVLILKRLSDAQRDGDPILALIRGSAVNQNGGSASIKAPNPVAQAAVVRDALAAARVSPEQVTFVEAHGSGTALGDAIEVQALREVLGAPTAGGGPCCLASAKTNIGHLETASGMAGIIKTVLALQHETIPAHLNFRKLSPNISFEGTRFEIPLTARPWTSAEGPRVAGVSAFGMSGTNAHVIVEEAPRIEESVAVPAAPLVLTISARSVEALRALAREYRARFAQASDERWLGRACFTANVRRTHHGHRLALVARTCAQVSADLQAFLSDQAPSGLCVGRVPSLRRKLGLLFPGHGAAGSGVARSLLALEPAFRVAFTECDAALGRAGAGSAFAQLESSEGGRSGAPEPALFFALQVALTATFRAWGVEPHALMGVGAGEVVAAHTAGALSLDEAARIVGARAELTRHAKDGGRVSASLATESLSAARLKLSPAAASLPLYSTLTSQQIEGAKLDAAYWARHVHEPALLGPTVDRLISEGCDVLIEVGCGSVLGASLEDRLARLGGSGTAIPLLRQEHEPREGMLEALARIYTLGCRVDWSRQYPRGLRPTELPTYAWQRQRYWSEGIHGR